MDFRNRIRIVRMIFLPTVKKRERAHAARALPFASSQKEAKRGTEAHPPCPPGARHSGSLLFDRHVGTRSANLPKLGDSHRLKHMGSFVFPPAVRGRGKNPLTSDATRFCGRCLGLPPAFCAAFIRYWLRR